jgi:beta-mannosidase
MHIDLNGIWKATADLGAQAKAGKPGYADSNWTSVPVPGHWQQAPTFAAHSGTLLYRKAFRNDYTLAPDETAQLRFDGLFYAAKVWLNGTFLGEHEGYFTPVQYDVTKALRPGENVVMVELTCEQEEGLTTKRQLIGVFGDWACKPPGNLPGGIWRDVTLTTHHGVVQDRFTLQAVPERLPANTAHVSMEMAYTAVAEGALTWQATIAPENFAGPVETHQGSQPTRRGANRFKTSLVMQAPHLWWTWDHGAPDLYRLTLAFSHNGGPTQTVERLFGVRTVELRHWHLYLNGRRIFMRGTNYGPADLRIASVTRERYQQDLDLMLAAHMNMARVHGHIAGPALYEEASRKGILLWQDFPLHRLYSRSVLNEARRQASSMVDLLGHWPAVAVWCCHGNPDRHSKGEETGVFARLTSRLGNWNKSTLAPALEQVVRKLDPTRPVVAHPATHHDWSWYQNRIEDLSKVLARFPDTAQFVTQFGAQSFPNPEHSRKFVAGEWPQINWSDLIDRHMLQAKIMEMRVPHSLAQTFEQYVAITQHSQAYLHKFFIEHFRRLKYNPCGGVLQYLFADSAPGITWSIVDYERAPKLAYQVVQEAFRPTTICADWPKPSYAPGALLSLRVYLLNDRYATFHATWSWAVVMHGETLASDSYGAQLGPDSRGVAPESINWTVPPNLAPGTVDLVLTLTLAGQPPICNRYSFSILSAV